MTQESVDIPTRSPGTMNLLLAVSSGILLGFSFPPSPFYTLAYIAFIPFFIVLERLQSYKEVLRYSYVFLFLFHVMTLYWTGGWTHGRDGWLMTSNAALLLLHPFFYMPSVLLSFFVRRRLGLIGGLVGFVFLWISYEYSHSLSETSFPWITVGNSQAYDLFRIQIAQFGSTYALSFLLLSFNASAFYLLFKLSSNEWHWRSRYSLGTLGILVFLYTAPLSYGYIERQNANQSEPSKVIQVALIQPNFDPWEKWGEGFVSKWDSYRNQLDTYLEETRIVASCQPDLIIWPETAIPYPLLVPRYSAELPRILRAIDSAEIPVFSGLYHIEFSDSLHASVTAQRVGNGLFSEAYNSAVLIEPGEKVSPVYKKNVLVPFAERIPYAETFKFLIEPLKWNVGISSWGKGHDTTVYFMHTRSGMQSRFSGMICYESVYPNFVREFVRKGAEFLIVITNDSWWGNTSGAYQHAAYASFRAIENRRWVVQCANGGISEFVDPWGKIYSPTTMFTRTRLKSHIEARNEMTFYTKYGDVFAQACLFCSAVIVILASIRKSRTLSP